VKVDSAVSEIKTEDSLWNWSSWNDLSYLTCNLLDNWQHGFFTQQFSPRSPAELAKTLQPEASVYRLKQVHGKEVLTPSEITANLDLNKSENELVDGDGIISDRDRQSVWVASADCNPILIGDINSGRVAAVHAGWRGTALKIVPEAIARFVNFGSSLEDLRIAIGPAIAGEVYQVDEEVATEVVASIIDRKGENAIEDILTIVKQLPNSPILEDAQPGKVRLDVKKANAFQLKQLGLKEEQISIAPYCTYQRSDYFFSYRRSNQKNVQWSGIVSQSFA
jgi:polyphenol oxidase